jgi:hypothetical protein
MYVSRVKVSPGGPVVKEQRVDQGGCTIYQMTRARVLCDAGVGPSVMPSAAASRLLSC